MGAAYICLRHLPPMAGFGIIDMIYDEGTVEPRIVPVGAEEFTRGWYAVA